MKSYTTLPSIPYSSLKPEAELYWRWHQIHHLAPLPEAVAREGAGSELRTPLMHVGTVMPIYLGIIRYLETIGPKKGMKLIELGSGSGRALAYLQSRFPELSVYGVDYSQACITYANQHYKKSGVTFKLMKPGKTRFHDETFDFVISSHVIEHVKKEDGKAFLAETRRLLKRGGLAFIGTPNRQRCQNIYMENPTDDPQYRLVPPHEHEYEQEELLHLAQSVFGMQHAMVDKLSNPLFAELFAETIATFKPNGTALSTYRHKMYRFATKSLPRPLFDSMSRMGMNRAVKKHHTSYEAILYNTTITAQTSRKRADNFLLVCKR